MRCHAIALAGALSLFIGVDSAEAKLEILVEKATQRMVVIQDGYMRYIWPVSTGRDALETPNGIYAPQRMERNWFSSSYYNSPMPYSIFFHNGYAIHGSYAVNQLGGPASHGCVRLHPHHAALLFGLVQQEGRENTTIEVTDEPQPDMRPRPPRETVQAREMPSPMQVSSPPMQKLDRPGEFGDMAELTGGQRAYRPAMARPPLRPPPPDRRRLTTLIEPIKPQQGPCGNRADSADCRGRPKAADAPRRERVEAAHAAQSALPTQPAPATPPAPAARPEQQAQVGGFKVLPASCWSGGASRWRWWHSGQGTPCK
jgi:L,D-transpeptidase-like protein